MVSTDGIQLRANGYDLDMGEDCLGRFEDSSGLLADTEALRRRMRDEGHVFLRGYLDRAQVLEARYAITRKMADAGVLDPEHPDIDAMPHPDYHDSAQHHLAQGDPVLEGLLYGGRMMELLERFLGGTVRHFDYTWLRALAPGTSTPIHCDIVYMGRGTQNLHTAWTPLGDSDMAMGGLMILERSHLHQRLRQTYCTKDVDAYCENRSSGEKVKAMFGQNGSLAPDPDRVRRSLGGRWLVGEFRAGDLIVFNPFMVHGGLDNQSDRIRLSSDSRYQLATEPIDERWNGSDPPTHGPRAKRAMIC